MGRIARRLSLRSRLLLGVIVVVAVGLSVAGSVVYGEIRSYLVNQLDSQLVQIGGGPSVYDCLANGGPRELGLPPDSFVFDYNAPGQEACIPFYASVKAPNSQSEIPTVPNSLLEQVANSGDGVLGSTSSPSGQSYAIYAWTPTSGAFRSSPPAVEVIAAPLGGVQATMHQLLFVDLAVSLAVLALLAALGYAVVRVGLRPLEDIEETARKIAAGDLSRRVARDEPETEIGRLGASLNAMLSQIEGAFAEQQASERRMRRFVADAAHELRTPLTSIRGYAELFRRGAAARPEDLGRSMRRIEQEATRMGVLVDDLLLLARLDQGRPLDMRPVDLTRIAADAAADAQAVQPERPITFQGSGPLVVQGDEARLRQVAANLVQNALVHTPEPTPVWVSVRQEAELAVLEVADDGPGIPAEHAARIFERFYRADSSRARQSGGTGLGLAIVASIADAHGGHASVATEPGRGARFRVELPMAGAVSAPAEPVAAPPDEAGRFTTGEAARADDLAAAVRLPPSDDAGVVPAVGTPSRLGGASGFSESWDDPPGTEAAGGAPDGASARDEAGSARSELPQRPR